MPIKALLFEQTLPDAIKSSLMVKLTARFPLVTISLTKAFCSSASVDRELTKARSTPCCSVIQGSIDLHDCMYVQG